MSLSVGDLRSAWPPLPCYLAAMAVIARILIEAAEQSDHDRLESSVPSGQGPWRPTRRADGARGLPGKRGVMIVEAWRTEESLRSYLDQVLKPALRDVGLSAGQPEVGPAWSIARP